MMSTIGRSLVSFQLYLPEISLTRGLLDRLLMPAFGPTAMHDMFDDMSDIASQLTLKWERYLVRIYLRTEC